MTMSKTPPYDFIQRNYREPKTDDPIKKWLPHPEVARAICGALRVWGIREHDLQDELQEVYVKALEAFRSKKTTVPTDLRKMKAFQLVRSFR
jgi:hypothetical protein